MFWDCNWMVVCVVQEFEDGMYVNFGIGILMFVVNYVGDKDIMLQLENGMFGMGLFLFEGEEDLDLINVGKQMIIELN